jgi:hypothetical protein
MVMKSKNIMIQRLGSFFFSSLSFPRMRESRNTLRKKLDARLRGNDGKNFLTLQLFKPREEI